MVAACGLSGSARYQLGKREVFPTVPTRALASEEERGCYGKPLSDYENKAGRVEYRDRRISPLFLCTLMCFQGCGRLYFCPYEMSQDEKKKGSKMSKWMPGFGLFMAIAC